MKKVLLLAVVVFGAVLVQAAECEWSVTFMTNDAQDWQDNGAMVMMFAGSDFADVKKLIATKTGDTLRSKLVGKTLKAEGSTSVMLLTAFADMIAETDTSLVSTLPSDGQAFWMIFTDNKLTETTTVYWTEVGYVSNTKLLTEDDFTTNATIAQIAEDYAVAPESGILALLALGVAGLALRRKVA